LNHDWFACQLQRAEFLRKGSHKGTLFRMFPLSLQSIISNQMRPRRLRGAWFGRLLRHPARRWSGSILSPGTHAGYFFECAVCVDVSVTYSRTDLKYTWHCCWFWQLLRNVLSYEKRLSFRILCCFRARKTRAAKSRKAVSGRAGTETVCIYSPAVDGKISEAVSEWLDAEKPVKNSSIIIREVGGWWRLVALQVCQQCHV